VFLYLFKTSLIEKTCLIILFSLAIISFVLFEKSFMKYSNLKLYF